ncbi:hypothetical protein [Cellulosimicrobium sp. Marseille-Q8652]
MTVPDAAVPLPAPAAPAVAAGSTAFAARALAARDRYDGVLSRALAHGADRAVLADALHDVATAAEPLAGQLDAEAFAATCDALLDAAARLVAARRWRTGGPERAAVLEVAPRLTAWLATAPAVTVAAVVDGARAVGGGPGPTGDVAAWSRRVVAASERTTGGQQGWEGASGAPTVEPGPRPAGTIRGAVLVAAWRSGLVRYRDAALDAARRLPGPVARAALSLPAGATGLEAVLDRHAADPWWWPGRGDEPTVLLRGVHGPARVLGRFGGFRGFGGPWLSPAVVVGADPQHPALRWSLRSADGTASAGGTVGWTLVADVHGSFVARALRSEDAVAQQDPGGVLCAGGGAPAPARDEDLADISGSASVDTPSGRLLLLSRTGSYDVLLVRWTR